MCALCIYIHLLCCLGHHRVQHGGHFLRQLCIGRYRHQCTIRVGLHVGRAVCGAHLGQAVQGSDPGRKCDLQRQGHHPTDPGPVLLHVPGKNTYLLIFFDTLGTISIPVIANFVL